MSTRGERVSQALEARGVRKQQALAAELKVHESAITRWKDDKPMSLENAVALGETLDVSLDWLLLGRGTLDSHKATDAVLHGIDEELFGRVLRRVSSRSVSLLLTAIDAIADDAASGSAA